MSVALLSNHIMVFMALHQVSKWHVICALMPCNDALARNACMLLVEQDLRVHCYIRYCILCHMRKCTWPR